MRAGFVVFVFSLAFCLGGFAPFPVGAQQSGQSADTPARIVLPSPLEQLARLLDIGNYEEALAVITLIEQVAEQDFSDSQRTEFSFLKGRFAMETGQLEAAEAIFEDILADDPGLVRVRLELARTHYLQKDYDRSVYNFNLALAGDLPDVAAARAYDFLDRIRANDTFGLQVNLALVPNSNINTATTEESIDIFGLLFQLGDGARAQTGIGINGQLNGHFIHDFSRRLRLRNNLVLERTEYDRKDFDDSILALASGPEYLFRRGFITAQARTHRRWFGTNGLTRGLGARVAAAYRISERVTMQGSAGLQRIIFDRNDGRDAWLTSLRFGAVRTLSPVSSLSLQFSFDYNDARARFETSRAYRLRSSYQRQFRNRILVEAGAGVTHRRFQARHPLFFERRKDIEADASLSVQFGQIRIAGFSPSIGYSYRQNFSALDLFDFSRHQGLFEFRRWF